MKLMHEISSISLTLSDLNFTFEACGSQSSNSKSISSWEHDLIYLVQVLSASAQGAERIAVQHKFGSEWKIYAKLL